MDTSILTPDDQPPSIDRINQTLEKRSHAIEKGRAIVSHACQLFGVEPALAPIKKGTKVPQTKRWQDISANLNLDADHLVSLGKDERSTGVVLGAPSSHLVAFDFDKQSHAETFLETNPTIADTLITHGNRGCTMWFVMVGSYPKSFDIRDPAGGNVLEFRADGRLSIFRGTHPSGKQYQVVNEGPPRPVEFATIKWPEGWEPLTGANAGSTAIVETAKPQVSAYDFVEGMLPSTFAANDRFGDPIIVDKKGKISINHFAFADSFACSYPVCYVENVGFKVYDPATGTWAIALEPEIHRRLGIVMEWYAREQGLGMLRAWRTSRFLGEITTTLKGLIREKWPSVPSELLHLANGMLQLGEGETKLLPFSPNYRSMAAIPHAWVPEAKCPRWHEFLAAALPPDDIELLQKWSGMVLTGFNSAQAIMLLVGVGGAGKGVIVEVLSAMLGHENAIQFRTKHLDDRFEMSMYYATTLLVGSDVPGDFLCDKSAQRVKSMTGHDPILMEFKNQRRPATKLGTWNMVITSNERLRVVLAGDEEAYRRRIKIIHFSKVPPRQIPGFAKSIVADEIEGIVGWAVEGWVKLRREISEKGRWSLSVDQQSRVDEFLAESDSLRAFIKRCIGKASLETTVSNSDILFAYHDFCDDNGWTPQPLRYVQKTVPVLMLSLHRISPRHDLAFDGSTRRGYSGVKILRETEASL